MQCSLHNVSLSVCLSPRGGGSLEKENVYPCLLGRQHETPTLTGTKFAKPYPYWHKIWAQIQTLAGTHPQKKGTLCGTTIVEKWLIGTIVGA